MEYSGLSRQTLHNYTTMGLIRESDWTRGGHRLYDETVFERLIRVARLKTDGKSLTDIQRLFLEEDQEDQTPAGSTTEREQGV
jgi:DNA-binding transcriptional MerR regulator